MTGGSGSQGWTAWTQSGH